MSHSVSDLKAEWILLKRDIEFLKKETSTLTAKQVQLTNDTVSLKLSLSVTESANRRLETRVSILKLDVEIFSVACFYYISNPEI